jgi:hypothetical protein
VATLAWQLAATCDGGVENAMNTIIIIIFSQFSKTINYNWSNILFI